MQQPERSPAEETQILSGATRGLSEESRRILWDIYQALQEKGYDPIRQLAYYLLSGEPTYITAHKGARSLATRLERDEVLEELVRFYLTHRLSEEGHHASGEAR